MKYKAMIKKVVFLAFFFAANLAFFLLLKSEIAMWFRGNFDYTAIKIYDKPLDNINKFSHDGKGEDQLIAVLPNFDYPPLTKEVLLFSPFHKTFKQVSFLLHLKVPLNYQYFEPLDTDGDRKVEIPFMWIVDRRFHFELRDLSGKTIKTLELEPLSLPIPSETIHFSPIAIEDIDADGRLELIWLVSGEFMGLPRGIVVHDLETGRLKWEYLFGAIPSKLRTSDINGDGRKEIIFSAWAPHNGYAYNNMNDDTSYIGVLRADGSLLWQKEAGGYFTEIFFDVADLDGDGKLEIVTARSCHRKISPDPGEICILDAASGSLIRYFSTPSTSYTQPVVADVDATPGIEIIIGDVSGALSILDNKLRCLRKVFLDDRVMILAANAFDTKNRRLIAARTGLSGFTLLDQNLKRLYEYKNMDRNNEKIELLSLRKGGKEQLLLNADRPYMLVNNPRSRTIFAVFHSRDFSLTFILGMAFNILALLYVRKKTGKDKKAPACKDDGWLTLTQEMVHRMKTPMTNILWEAEQLKTGLENVKDLGALTEAVRKTPDSLIGELKELKLMNRYLMKFLQIQSPKLKQTDFNLLLHEEAGKYVRHLKDRITVKLDLDQRLPHFHADEEQIAEVFINIIENAIDAMPDGGKLAISSRWLHDNKKGAEIIFRDTGRGIPEDQLKMIFTSNYTTKKEGFGIGLPVCQRIISAHGGKIEIKSQVGIGTIIALFIPWERSATRKNE